MMRLEILGESNLFKTASALLESGYSIHIPYMPEHENQEKEERYYILECSFVKYEAPKFILEPVEEDF